MLNNRPPELLAVSIKGTVPVLCINDTTVIDESLDIMKWALIQNDPNLWIHYNKEMQFDIIEENDNEFKYWLDRYKYFNRFPEKDDDPVAVIENSGVLSINAGYLVAYV